jgi:lipoprotein-releasing system permease protein
MNFPFYIAKRYLRSKSGNNAINFITIIALIGVVLGAASLFVVLSGFAGLKDFTLQFSTIVDPALKAETAIGKSFLLTEDEVSRLNNIEEIALYSKVIEERVFIASEDKTYLHAYIKGVDEHFQFVNTIDSVIVQGGWLDQKSNQIVVGWGISRNLSFGVLDYAKTVNLYVPKPGKGIISSTKSAFNTVNAINVGIFDINETLNDKYIYASINLAQQLLNYKPNQISSIEFRLKEGVDQAVARQKIKDVLGDKIILKNRMQINDALYKMLNAENLFVYLLITLVSMLLIFNVIGSIIMMILEKKENLNSLFSVGVTIKNLRKIFFYQGSLITLLGTILGLLIGVIIVSLQTQFLLVMLTPSLPYPTPIKFKNFFIVFFTISILGVLASKIASRRVTKTLIEAN